MMVVSSYEQEVDTKYAYVLFTYLDEIDETDILYNDQYRYHPVNFSKLRFILTKEVM